MFHAYHLTTKTRPPFSPLTDRDACVDLWKRLRARFPRVAACVLMPNHVHMVVLTPHYVQAKWDLSVELRAWTRKHHPGKNLWEPIPEADPIRDAPTLKRQIRYVHLNPCRAELTHDPLEWEWSTHLDVTGCIANPWPDKQTLEKAFGNYSTRLGEVIHKYVSSDPSVAVSGTPMIRTPETGATLVGSDLSTLIRAVAAILRVERKMQRGAFRDLVIHCANRLRFKPDLKVLKIQQKCWERTLKRKVDEKSVQAVLKILGDRRCRF